MMLDKIGTMGSTQGVKASPIPARKKRRSVLRLKPPARRAAKAPSGAEADTGDPAALGAVARAGPIAVTAPASAPANAIQRVSGG